MIDDTITVLAMDVNEVTETTAALENLTLKDSERVVDDDNKALVSVDKVNVEKKRKE